MGTKTKLDRVRSNTELDARYVNVSGDTMTGTLNTPKLVATGSADNEFYSDTLIGGASDYCKISSGGVITYAGTAKRSLTMRPAFVAGKTAGSGKPTPVAVGVWAGYSMPIYNSDDEELFWRLHFPGRWDGASNITYYLLVCISAAETLGDDFRIQVSWNHVDGSTGVIDATAVQDLTADGDCAADHNAQYSIFTLSFSIDWDIDTPDIIVGDTLAGRVRRIASGGVEIAGEVIVLDHWLTFTVDKVFKA